MAQVMGVLGPIAGADLGMTLPHEHLRSHGGCGHVHVPTAFAQLRRHAGVNDRTVDRILIGNPQRASVVPLTARRISTVTGGWCKCVIGMT